MDQSAGLKPAGGVGNVDGSAARDNDVATSTAPLHVARVCASVLLATLALGPAAAAPDIAAMGKPLFDQSCGGCHQIGLGARHAKGPQLNGIIGMPAGNMRGFTYSTAMQRSAVVWTAKSFDIFIANPRTAMPGTHMVVPGVASEPERRAITAYVARFEADGKMREAP